MMQISIIYRGQRGCACVSARTQICAAINSQKNTCNDNVGVLEDDREQPIECHRVSELRALDHARRKKLYASIYSNVNV